ENVIGREADDKQVGGRAMTQVFVRDQFSGKSKFILVGKWRGRKILRGDGAQSLAGAIFPFPADVLSMLAGVESLRPVGQIATVIGRGHKVAGLVHPISSIAGKSG